MSTGAVAAVRGSAFGFDVESPFEFETLRPPGGLQRLAVVAGSADPPVRAGELVAELVEPGFLARIFHDDGIYRLWVDRVGWFEVEPAAARVTAPPAAQPLEREEIVLGVPALLCFLARDNASLHAAAIDLGGAAVAFVAPQGQGKSTLAAAFARRGYRVLAEDLACIQLEPQPAVVPGPAALRLRNDVAARFDMTFARCLHAGRVKTRYRLSESAASTAAVPLVALVVLQRGVGGIRLESVAPMRALPDLWQASFRVTRGHERHCFESIAALAHAVPLWTLRRPLELDALDATVAVVVAALAGSRPGRVAAAD